MTDIWHVLTTEPQREVAAAAGLIGRRFHPYLPTRTIKRAHGRTRKTVTATLPLIPGYLFLNMDPKAGLWNKVRAIPGIRDFLVVNGIKATLSSVAMDLLRQIEEAENVRRNNPVSRAWEFKAGDYVRVGAQGGVHAGLHGVFQRIDKSDKAILHVVLPSRVWPVVTSAAWLEKAG